MFENKEEEEYFNFPNLNSSLTQNQSYYDNSLNIRDSLSLLDKTNEIINTRRSIIDKSKDQFLNEEEEKVNNFKNNNKNKKGYYHNSISSDINNYDKAHKRMGKKMENNTFGHKTHFNYDELAKQADKKNDKNKGNTNNENNIIINYNKNYSFGNRDTNETKSAHFNLDTNNASQKEEMEEREEREEKQIQIINNENINNKDNKLVKKSIYNFNYSNNILNKNEAKNSANIQPTLEHSNNINIFKDNKLNITNLKESQNFKSIDIMNDNKDNNSDISSNFCDSKTSLNSIDSFKIKKANEEEKEMRVQIKLEEEKLKELEKEKEQLLKEEKERQQEIINELNRNEMKKIQLKKIYKETQKKKQMNKKILKNIKKEQEKKKEEIKQLLKKSKRDEEHLKSMADVKTNKNNDKNIYKNNNFKNINNEYNQEDDIHYDGLLHDLENENNMGMNKNRINKINKYNFASSVRLKKNNIQNKNLLSFDVKKTNKDNFAIKNYFNLNNYLNNENDMNYNNIQYNNISYNNNLISNEYKNKDNSEYNFNYNYKYNSRINKDENMKNYNSYQNINYKNINDLYNKIDNKSKDITNLKYNFSSYFRLDDKYKYDIPALNTNIYYNNNPNNEKNYIKNDLNDNNLSNRKNRSISLTPNGFYRIKNNDNNEYINIRTCSIENNNTVKTDKKEEIIKTLSQNNSNNTTQSRFYKRIIPNENQKLNNNNFDYGPNTYKNRNIKNRYNGNNRISHSFTNLTYNSLYKNNSNNDYSNSYSINNKSHIKNRTYNGILYNNIYNNIFDNVNDFNYNYNYKKSINANMNDIISHFLKRGNSYTNLHSLLKKNNNIIANDERMNLNEIIPNNYNYNYSYNNAKPKSFSDIRNYRFSSPPNDFNNYVNSFNMNYKGMGNQNGNLYNTCLRRRMLNDNELEDIFSYQREKNYFSRNNSHNNFIYNMKRLCQNCQNIYHLNKFKQL